MTGALFTQANLINLSDEELDRHIYRITKEEHVLSLFTERENVLSQVHRWKDKFENFQMNLGGLLNGQKFTYEFKDDFGGQCWTTQNFSEAMWGIYASDPNVHYLRIRSTPRKLLTALIEAHPLMPQDACFVGRVEYKKESDLKAYLQEGAPLNLSAAGFAKSLLLKRNAFRHEHEVRLLYFGSVKKYDTKGLYRYDVDPHQLITQIMADPNRDRNKWLNDKATIQAITGFTGDIKRSKIYDPPEWNAPAYT